MQAACPSHQVSEGARLDSTAVASIVHATSVAVIMLNVAPAAETYLRQDAHLSSGQVGTVLFVELAAMGLASFPAYGWLGRADPCRVARWAYALFILGNAAASLPLASFAFYAATRAVTGFGAGTLMVLAMSMAARARNPDRMYALVTFGQLASGTFMLWTLAGGGRRLNDLFHASAWLGALGFVMAGSLSRVGNHVGLAQRKNPPAPSTAWRVTLLAIAFAMAFNLVVGGLWSFAAEYADAGTTPAHVALVLAWATAAGLAGAASAVLIGNRWSRRHMLIAGYLGILLGAGLLQFTHGPAAFAAGCCVLSLAWNFCVPYVFAAVAGQDPTGRLMSAANLAFAFGLALGPLLGGEIIENLGLNALFPCALSGLILGVALTLRITRPSSP